MIQILRIVLVCGALVVPQIASAVTDPPTVPLGCQVVGDPAYDDVWHFCPAGKKKCYRWSGYSVFPGKWPACDSFGEPPIPPCSWDGSSSMWRCYGHGSFKCTDIMCG